MGKRWVFPMYVFTGVCFPVEKSLLSRSCGPVKFPSADEENRTSFIQFFWETRTGAALYSCFRCGIFIIIKIQYAEKHNDPSAAQYGYGEISAKCFLFIILPHI